MHGASEYCSHLILQNVKGNLMLHVNRGLYNFTILWDNSVPLHMLPAQRKCVGHSFQYSVRDTQYYRGTCQP